MLLNRTVVIVESVHLVGRLNALLKEIGFQSPFVIATLGRIKDIEPDTTVDNANFESSRIVLHPEIARKISKIKDSQVYVATDNDIEGELIARDVYELVEDSHNQVFRVSIDALTAESLAKALVNTRKIDPKLIETCLSRRSADKQIEQFSPGAGRVISYALGQVTKPPPSSERDQLLTEISLSGINTVSLLAHGITHGARPLEISHSLQKLYSQGRISYPRTLDGISSSRNLLADVDPHSAIETVSAHFTHHYDTPVDDLMLNAIREKKITPREEERGNKTLDALLALYKMPYMRASTVSHHTERLSRFIGNQSLSLTGFGWSAYLKASSALPMLCSPNGSVKLHEILHDDSLRHTERVTTALAHLGINEGDKKQGSPVFKYPDDYIQPNSSPDGPQV